jgi:hypothetical protein
MIGVGSNFADSLTPSVQRSLFADCIAPDLTITKMICCRICCKKAHILTVLPGTGEGGIRTLGSSATSTDTTLRAREGLAELHGRRGGARGSIAFAFPTTRTNEHFRTALCERDGGRGSTGTARSPNFCCVTQERYAIVLTQANQSERTIIWGRKFMAFRRPIVSAFARRRFRFAARRNHGCHPCESRLNLIIVGGGPRPAERDRLEQS